jgi:hypothetical protein
MGDAGKRERRARLMPAASGSARLDAKGVLAWWNLRVERRALIANVDPILVVRLEPVAEANVAWLEKRQCGVFDLQVAFVDGV